MSTEEKLAGVIGWLAELDYPGVGDQMQALSDAASAISSLSAEVQKLREALRPFAVAADDAELFRQHGGYPNAADDETASFNQRNGGRIIFEPTMGQLRRARAALKPETKERS
jgi:hypothetical protein